MREFFFGVVKFVSYEKGFSTNSPLLQRHGGLMISEVDSTVCICSQAWPVLDLGSRGLGSSQCVVFLCKTLYSYSVCLHPGV